jgi:hypothetical protein
MKPAAKILHETGKFQNLNMQLLNNSKDTESKALEL